MSAGNTNTRVVRVTMHDSDGSTDTLAVPDALWTDADFLAAIVDRADAEVESGYEGPSSELYLAAIHAELRARAGEGA